MNGPTPDRDFEPEPIVVRFRLNGRERVVQTFPHVVLADLLHDELGQTDVRVSCDQGVCGACTVLLDGEPATACLTPCFDLEGKIVVTAKGLGEDNALNDVQRAFVDVSAFQCGYCTPGMVVSATALLAANADPSREDIQSWLGANICRCTGYQVIVEAVELAARRRNGARD